MWDNMENKIILLDKGKMAVLTLNRPEKGNCIDLDLINELGDAILRLKRGQNKVVILTGAGKAFSTGADINAIGGIKKEKDIIVSGRKVEEYLIKVHDVFMELEELKMPVIAAIRGPCYGGGLELALTCDIRISSLNATFAFPEVSIGLIPGAGGTYRLPNIIGEARAKEMVYLGRYGGIPSWKALNIGLVNRLAWNPLKAAEAMTEKMSRNSYNAIVEAKGAIAGRRDYRKSCETEINAFMECFRHNDSSEGINAFKEKRHPNFENNFDGVQHE